EVIASPRHPKIHSAFNTHGRHPAVSLRKLSTLSNLIKALNALHAHHKIMKSASCTNRRLKQGKAHT
ncbi:MAG: hypothetical protein ABJ246_08015, partial [Paracoccaceae bacterium]